MLNEILLKWYDENKRELPWRKSKDPYIIWVSEIMLQQTRVEAVKPYFNRFIQTLPTLKDLAMCEDDVLHKLWEGLGYYSRVRNMKKAALLCMEKYGGKMPSSYEELLTLPGIGPYTAAAVASIAFNASKIALDGNVLRVLSRVLNIQEDIDSAQAKAQIYTYFEKHPCAFMGDMNQAFMDFANAICLPNNLLRCNICPLRNVCEGYKANTASSLPHKKAKKARRKEKYTVLMYVCDGEVLLRKRPAQGLLAGLYEFVLLEGHKTKKELQKALYVGKYKHIFSHVEWDMKGFIVFCDDKDMDGVWADEKAVLSQYSIPSAFTFYKDKVLDYMRSPFQN